MRGSQIPLAVVTTISVAAIVAFIAVDSDPHPRPVAAAPPPPMTVPVEPICTGDTILNMEAVCNTDPYIVFLTSEVLTSRTRLTLEHPTLVRWFNNCAKYISDLDRCTLYMTGVLFPMIDYNIRNGVR